MGAYNCLKPHLTYKNINHYNNLYLLLLSHLIKLPDGNSDYVKHFDFNDLTTGKANRSKDSIKTNNQIAFDIIHGHFRDALKGILSIGHYDIKSYITYKLLSSIVKKIVLYHFK